MRVVLAYLVGAAALLVVIAGVTVVAAVVALVVNAHRRRRVTRLAVRMRRHPRVTNRLFRQITEGLPELHTLPSRLGDLYGLPDRSA